MRTFLVMSVLAFAAGTASLNSGLPSQKLIDRLEAQIQIRFRDVYTGRFGVSRLGEPYKSHQSSYTLPGSNPKMKAENEKEEAILSSLAEDGWDVVAFTASKRYTKRPPPTKGLVERPVSYVRCNGPVTIAGKGRRDFRAGTSYPDLDKQALAAIDSGKGSTEFAYEEWRFVTRQVPARAECLSCHTERNGHKMEVGESIGIFLLGFKKATD